MILYITHWLTRAAAVPASGDTDRRNGALHGRAGSRDLQGPGLHSAPHCKSIFTYMSETSVTPYLYVAN